MDVFSLVKFWRNAGVGDLDINTDDEGSFFDLVFTNPNDLEGNDSPNVHVINSGGDHYHQQCYCSKLDGADLKSNHMTYSSPSLFNINKRKVLPLDATTKSPFRVFMLGFQNSKFKRSDDSCNQMPSKRFSKDVVHRYLNLIKPLYTRRSNEKKLVRLSEHSGRSVFKHLGKSRSSSSVVKPFPSPGATARRDDSADGIQGAILHCKKSYNSPSQGSGLSRSGSAPFQGTRISVDEQEKRSSI